MNTNRFIASTLACCSLSALCLHAALPTSSTQLQVTARGADYRVWTRIETNIVNGKAITRTRGYIELETGMNYWSAGSGSWIPSEEIIDLEGNGAVAQSLGYRVEFPPNLNKVGAVKITLPDGRSLATHVLGLAYTAGNQAVLIALVKDCNGEISGNEVTYRDVFDGISADVRYRVKKGSFEQDIILRSQIPGPAEFGMPENSILEVFTEAVNPPQLQATVETPATKSGLSDRNVDFGSMKIISGKAFSLDGTSPPQPVAKEWTQLEGRTFLIERIEWQKIKVPIAQLPKNQQASLSSPLNFDLLASRGDVLPHLIASDKPAKPLRLALNVPPAEGYVLDYILVSSSSVVTFERGQTYYITGPVTLSGTTTFEPSVIKFAPTNSAELKLTGPVIVKAGQHEPIVLTARDDHSVGEAITSESLSGYYATVALHIDYDTSASLVQLPNFRISYANQAIKFSGGNGHVLKHLQLLNCSAGIHGAGAHYAVRNGLFYNVVTALSGSGTSVARMEHVTFNGTPALNPGTSTTLFLTNSILRGVTSGATYSGQNNEAIATSAQPFQTVFRGGHYLTNGSVLRDAGTTNIESSLKSDLKRRTTFPPTVFETVLIPTNVLHQTAPRDTGLPDLGYHYDPLDYILSDATSSQLTVTKGVVLGLAGTNGLFLYGSFASDGTVDEPNRVVISDWAQEIAPTTVLNPYFINVPFGNYSTFDIRCRFTEFPWDQATYANFLSVYDATLHPSVSFRDCHVRGFNYFNITAGHGSGLGVSLINNIFESSYIELRAERPWNCDWIENEYWCGYFASAMGVGVYNNLFRNSTFEPVYVAGAGSGNPTWGIQNNLFDTSSGLFYYTDDYGLEGHPFVVTGNNAFTTGSDNYLGGTGDIEDLTADFASGPLGPYYYPSTGGNLSELIDAGTGTAPDLGLYHFTTRPDQAKEGSSSLDIGFHYVALTSGSVPFDFDGDGLPDYLEDSAGDGYFIGGDLADYRNIDSDGDGLPDGYEYFVTRTSPNTAATGGGTSDAYKDLDSDGLNNQEEMQLGKNPLVPDVAQPLFSPVGGSYTSTRTVTITCPTTGATIRYTLDGTEPTASSTSITSGSTVSISASATLKAKAWKTGWTASDTASEGYRIEATPSNVAPTLTVLPGTGLTFGGSDSIEILVQAADADGTIARVQLYRGDYKVAETTSSPLRFTLHNAPSATYAFTARAIDNAGAVTVSSSVSIAVHSSGPVVSLVGAQPFFTSSPGALIANITGVNPGSLSYVTLNGSGIPARAGEFMLFPALSEGENTFILSVTDNASHTAKATNKVYLDSTVPTIAITAPASSSFFSTERINVTGTFTEASLKRITVNGVLAFTGSGTFEARNVFLPEGANAITAIVEDISGNTNAATISVTGSATPVDPVQLTVSPVAGFASLSTTFTISANAPGTLQYVDFDFDGDGTTDQTETTSSSISHTYTTAGQYFPVVTLQTTAGRFSSLGGWNAGQALRVNVQEAPQQIGSAISIADPVDLKVGPSAHLFILSRSGELVKQYDATPSYVRSITLPSGSVPTGLDVDANGNAYVALSGHHQIAKYKLSSGSYGLDTAFNGTGLIGKSTQTTGTGNGEFNTPYDVAVTPDGTQIAVSDSVNHRIQLFNASDGAFISKFGASGSGAGQFTTPKGLTYDGASYLYIVDSGNSRVALALSSSVIGTSGSSGSALGQFSGAVNLCVGPRGIYVGETGNNRVQAFEPLPTGHSSALTPFETRLAVSTELSLSQPNAIAVIADALAEKIYIADTGHGKVIKVSLPETETPDAKWNAMKTILLGGNVDQAVSYFSSASKEDYRRSFTAMGSTVISSVINKTLTPAFIGGDNAQYYFQDVIGGETITFPVTFTKENGVWKILEF